MSIKVELKDVRSIAVLYIHVHSNHAVHTLKIHTFVKEESKADNNVHT